MTAHRTKETNVEFDVTIEIPKGQRNKYEIDHDTGRVRLDRYLYTPMAYPADYGYIDNSLGSDGDPLDCLVLLPESVYPGVIVEARPVGVLLMTDQSGRDEKIVAVPASDQRWNHIQNVTDIPEFDRKAIEHFFTHYKDLEPGKWSKVEGWDDRAQAETLVVEAKQRLKDQASH
ncbi:inorganic diphosphatase [Nocardia terpenica]|uniref:inorganic diphosphatase n=1 Tax=Nocardia terpenica TaxID=455432 RepID=UPI00189624E9|nr:inorganic diphosphatase [Nocardia terpenica]MBF6066132.1 inorganic diphosphatase [Nocardia terpenica]MBF6109177.1 inorganic diphosphatase [Nocardia terpenica]MBF6116376.1 inorganic diphosphatase [Nocardia terpenica]MBF6123533.1 inorganic diphosphatase [Nocardia terpenica]MBF6156810.1 inorganic diphosphatase [Nocardia terpenica]